MISLSTKTISQLLILQLQVQIYTGHTMIIDLLTMKSHLQETFSIIQLKTEDIILEKNSPTISFHLLLVLLSL